MTTLKGTAKYNKANVLKQLREAEAAVLRTIQTHEQALIQWRESAPRKLAGAIEQYGDGKQGYHSSMFNFEPPRLNTACADYRVQGLNKCILRIEAMAGDRQDGAITLRGDDPLWDYVGLAACL